jgi:DNA replication protein DnaC
MREKDLGTLEKMTLSIVSPSKRPSSDSCEHCGSPLTRMSLKVFGEEIVLRPACECRLRELEEREKRARVEELRLSIRRQGLEEGLYARMSLKEWECRDLSCEEAAKKLEVYLNRVRHGERNWLYLFGAHGLGKTHIAVAALKYLCLERQWEPLLVRWSEYCSRIQQSWHSQEAESEYQLLRKASNLTLLVLDDIDKRASSEWALGKLFELIDHRYLRQLPTILTANRSLEALLTYWERNEQTQDLARAIISRIMGQLLGVIEFSGQDYRLRGIRCNSPPALESEKD